MGRRQIGFGRVMVMEPGVKIAAAGSVLLGGILAALMFRHDVPGPRTDLPGNGDRLVLGERLQSPQTVPPAASRDDGRSKPPFSAPVAAAAAGQRVTVLTPADPGEAPPELARDYPGTDVPGASGWGTSIGLPPVTGRVPPLRTHKIVDGDTLEALAGRYLGSADRHLEIYEANRDVLPSPKLLPIGAELKIPPPGPATPRP